MENKKLLLVTGLGGIGKVHYDSERIVLNLMKLRNRYGLTQNQLAKKLMLLILLFRELRTLLCSQH